MAWRRRNRLGNQIFIVGAHSMMGNCGTGIECGTKSLWRGNVSHDKKRHRDGLGNQIAPNLHQVIASHSSVVYASQIANSKIMLDDIFCTKPQNRRYSNFKFTSSCVYTTKILRYKFLNLIKREVTNFECKINWCT